MSLCGGRAMDRVGSMDAKPKEQVFGSPDVGRSIRVYHSLVSVFVLNVRYQTVERTHLRLFNTSTF